MKKTKVLVTYDFITTEKELGFSLLVKLDFLRKIFKVLNIEVFFINILKEQFNQSSFFSSMKKEFTSSKFFNSFNLNDVNELNKEKVKNFLKQYDYIIAYELSPETKELFDLCGIQYIDIWMAPIRFCDDIMFSFTSNVEAVQKCLIDYRVDKNFIERKAKELSKHIKLFENDDISINDNSVLLVGQVLQDKSLLKDGKFLRLTDFKNEIVNLSNKYETIYLLKHPYMTKTEFTQYKNSFKDISNLVYLQNVNIYLLLAKKEIKKVVGISSSVLIEAKFFNKEVEYFYKPIFSKSFIPIYRSYYEIEFWAKIFGIEEFDSASYLNYDNMQRYSFNAFYSYEYFMKDKKLYDSRMKSKNSYGALVELFYLLDGLNKEKEYVLYGYGTIGKLILPFLKTNNFSIRCILDKELSEKQIDSINDIDIKTFNDLTKEDNVIITASLYNDLIEKSLKKVGCNIIKLLE